MLRAIRGVDTNLDFDGSGLWDIFMRHPDSSALVDLYRRVFRVGTLAYAPQQHLPAFILRQLVSPEIWNGSFKFAFVRNPWEMLVSGYHYWISQTPEQRALNPDVAELLHRCRDFSDIVRAYPMIRADMTSFITDEAGEDLMDFVGRFERLDEDFAYVCKRLGVNVLLEHENQSKHGSYRSYYTPETRAIVARHFARDIERFGYTF